MSGQDRLTVRSDMTLRVHLLLCLPWMPVATLTGPKHEPDSNPSKKAQAYHTRQKQAAE